MAELKTRLRASVVAFDAAMDALLSAESEVRAALALALIDDPDAPPPPPPPPPEPTYLLTAASAAVNEGALVVVELQTTHVAVGTLVPYTITGVQPDDMIGSLSGAFEIDAAGRAQSARTIVADALTEGDETLTLTLDGRTESVSVLINDTSQTPAPTYSLSASALEVSEGESVTFTLSTTNVQDGAVFDYTITGVSAGDVTAGQLRGSLVVAAGVAQVTVGVVADLLTEGPEAMLFMLDGGQASVAVTVLDTSVTPPPPPPPPPPIPPPEVTEPAVLQVFNTGVGPQMSCTGPINRSVELSNYWRYGSFGFFYNTHVITFTFQYAYSDRPGVMPRGRLIIGGVPATEYLSPVGAVYVFTVTVPNGHHAAWVQMEGANVRCYGVEFVVNDTGVPLAEQKPWLCTNRYDAREGQFASIAAQIQYGTKQPTVKPFKPRVIEPYSDLLQKSQMWVRAGALNFTGANVRGWALAPSGDVVIEAEQKYHHGDGATTSEAVRRRSPSCSVVDGQPGMSRKGYVAAIRARRGNKGHYFVETGGAWRFSSPEGKLSTLAGQRVKLGSLKPHRDMISSMWQYYGKPEAAAHAAYYHSMWEDPADYSQIPGYKGMWEPWDQEVLLRLPDGSIDNHDGHEGWITDTRNHCVVFCNHWDAHSLASWSAAQFPPRNYVQSAGPTGRTTVALFVGTVGPDGVGVPTAECNGPWGIRLRLQDEMMHWSNNEGFSIYKRTLSGHEPSVKVLESPVDCRPTWAQIGAQGGTRLGLPTISPVTLRQRWLRDGPVGQASCVYPTQIGFDSEGNLWWTEAYLFVLRKLDFATGMVTTMARITDTIGGSDSSAQREPCMSIDSEGQAGPKDDVFVHCWANVSDRRYAKDGTLRYTPFFNSGKYAPNGPANLTMGANYSWAVEAGCGQILGAGNDSGSQDQQIVRRLPTDPAFDEAKWTRGWTAWSRTGALIAIFGPHAQNGLGLSNRFDLAAMDDASLTAFLVSYGVPVASVSDAMYYVRWLSVDHNLA